MDTIRLKFLYHLPSSDFFSEKVATKELRLAKSSGVRYVWTNTKWRKERTEKGVYTPKYWVQQEFNDGNKTHFVIEFSVPKLIFGENLSEVRQEDFPLVVYAIAAFCKEIGVRIFTTQIEKARPTLVAIGKNISLANICSTSLALRTLAPFDYKPHADYRVVHFSDYKNGGRELYLNIKKTETTKFYDKKLDILNRAGTIQEKKLAEMIRRKDRPFEVLRMERTFKTSRKIKEKFNSFLSGKEPTFKNIFNPSIWDALLAEEAKLVLGHPLKNFIFLSVEEQPFIDAFLSKHFPQIRTRHIVWGFIKELQENSLAVTRKKYLDGFKSRQTWYNYQSRLRQLSRQIDISTLKNLSSYKIHSYILKQLGIDAPHQGQLFDTEVSKNIDA